jgi:hypothetical protein
MTPQTDTTNDCLPDWYDPFPEPNTIPDGWDVSNLMMGVRAFSNEQRSAAQVNTAVPHPHENLPSYHH